MDMECPKCFTDYYVSNAEGFICKRCGHEDMRRYTPTEQRIVDLASKMERYRIALQGCHIAVTSELTEGTDDSIRGTLRFIEKETSTALYGEEGSG